MAKPQPGIHFHVSPKHDLHLKGLDPQAEPHVTQTKAGWVYLGSDDYIHNQYLKYAKPGTYYLYKIDTRGLEADHAPLTPGQQRYEAKIEPARIKKISVINTSKTHDTGGKHPDEQAYLNWYNSIARDPN
jgi:hypothetical protein